MIYAVLADSMGYDLTEAREAVLLLILSITDVLSGRKIQHGRV